MPDRDANLYARAARTFGALPISDAVAKVRAIVGVPEVPDSEKAAQAALDKLKGGKQRPTAVELAALEFVIRMMRPAPLSRNGALDPLPAEKGSSVYQPAVETAWETFRTAVKPVLYSVGRLDRIAGVNQNIGTGFLVADDLVLTNHHVVTALSHGADELDEGMAVIRFYQEVDGPEPVPACAVTEVVKIHPTLDMALVRVRVPDKRPPLTLDTRALPANLMVSAIGYPYEDDRNPLFVDAIFEGKYGVKRGAFGELMGSEAPFIYHDCSTLGGNSGSPILALETGAVVGLHFTGDFIYRNGAVGAAAVAEFVASATGTP